MLNMLWEHCLVKTNIIEVQISLYCLYCLHISSTSSYYFNFFIFSVIGIVMRFCCIKRRQNSWSYIKRILESFTQGGRITCKITGNKIAKTKEGMTWKCPTFIYFQLRFLSVNIWKELNIECKNCQRYQKIWLISVFR